VTGESFFARQVKVISRLVGRCYGQDSSLARLFWSSLAFVVYKKSGFGFEGSCIWGPGGCVIYCLLCCCL
jgi:hypothetical protein